MGSRPTTSFDSASAEVDFDEPTHDPVLWLLAMVNFLVGMGAFLVVGLLSQIQNSLDITLLHAGYLLSVYSITYAICSPFGVALTGKLDRKIVLVGCLFVFTIATLVAVTASSYSQLLLARIVTAAVAAIITPVTASIAISNSAAKNAGRSLSRVFLGFTLAQVVGVPLGSFLGHSFGWEAGFILVFGLSCLVTMMLLKMLRGNITAEYNGLSTLKATLADWREVFSILCTSTFICSIYILYTFLEPLAVENFNYGRDEIAALLLVFGLGAVIGNHLGGILTDRIGPIGTLALLCAIQSILMPLFSFLPKSTPVLLVLVFLWSVFSWSFMIAQQNRLVRQSPERQAILLALNASAIYLGAALGSILGGLVVTFGGLQALGVAGGLGAIAALLHLTYSEILLRPVGFTSN